jgi:hypothetical protein
MLAITFVNFHIEGGKVFMVPLTLLFTINIFIFFHVLSAIIRKKEIHTNWLESIKQIGGLAAAWGTWSTILGLFQAFDALENSPEVIPFPVICGGLKVASLTVLYGLAIYCISLLAYITIKLVNQRQSPAQIK